MFFWRALLGIGEASYGIIAPALLADLFPPKYRGRVMGLYFLALPVGGAIGSGIGGWFSTPHRLAAAPSGSSGFPACSPRWPGLLMHDPGRGASEGQGHGQGRPAQPGRLPVDLPDPHLRLQHRRPGRRHLRPRRLRRLGGHVLPAGPGDGRRPGGRLDRRPDGDRRPAGDLARHGRGRLPRPVHPAGLPDLGRPGGGHRRALHRRDDPRIRPEYQRWPTCSWPRS